MVDQYYNPTQDLYQINPSYQPGYSYNPTQDLSQINPGFKPTSATYISGPMQGQTVQIDKQGLVPTQSNYQAPTPTPLKDIATQGQGEKDAYARSKGFPGWNELMASMNGPSEAEINSIYQPTFDYLNQAQSTFEGQYPQTQKLIGDQYQTSLGNLTSEKDRGSRELGLSQNKADQTKVDASEAARRLYQELVTGGQQRFGGASSAANAYSELNAVEQQRRVGDIQKTWSQAVQQIDNQRANLNERFASATAELENQKNIALNDARNEFQNKLLEITRMKAEAESNKASMRLQALQDLRNRVFQINLQQMQFAQQLALQKQNSDTALSTYQQQVTQGIGVGDSALSTQQSQTSFNPSTNLTMSAPSSYLSQITPTGNAMSLGRKKDELYA